MIYFYYLLIYKCKVSVPNSQLGIIFFHLVSICLLRTLYTIILSLSITYFTFLSFTSIFIYGIIYLYTKGEKA